MTKFSKKLVSKCIYILILKSTEVDLLDMFMSAGGWDLTFGWLSDGIQAKNWPLVVELVELLLICPVDIERLKGNNCPKIIKLLSKDITATEHVRKLAGEVVEQWLAIVKGVCEATASQAAPSVSKSLNQDMTADPGEVENGVEEIQEEDTDTQLPVYKITIRDGKQVLAEVISSDRTTPSVKQGTAEVVIQACDSNPPAAPGEVAPAPRTIGTNSSSPTESEDEVKPVLLGRRRLANKKELARKRAVKRPSNDPDFVVGKSATPAKKKTAADKRAKLETRKEETKKEDGKKDKSKSSLSLKDRAKIAKDDQQASLDKSTLSKLIIPSIGNLGKIPKKSSSSSSAKEEEEKKPERKPVEPPKPVPKDPKKYNISVETRKGQPDRPKTVKTYNSKFRSTGLEEAPPPPKSVKKTEKRSADEDEARPPAKRSSPPKETSPPATPANAAPPNDKKPKDDEKKNEKLTTPPKSKSKLFDFANFYFCLLVTGFIRVIIVCHKYFR
ncbi:hypothetical protein AAG570_001686 [Ranatra chinensis]|uniref:TFIIS N-terminal domain-containing protein n=1 Tax=Ranatra chinensis TaxID=642074 RepID=A0ABD0Y988_9HEMI